MCRETSKTPTPNPFAADLALPLFDFDRGEEHRSELFRWDLAASSLTNCQHAQFENGVKGLNVFEPNDLRVDVQNDFARRQFRESITTKPHWTVPDGEWSGAGQDFAFERRTGFCISKKNGILTLKEDRDFAFVIRTGFVFVIRTGSGLGKGVQTQKWTSPKPFW